MAIIIETCPMCGHDLHDLVIATNPPIPKKECFNCGWHWEGEPEQVIRRPFGGNSLNYDKEYALMGSNYDNEFINVNCDDSNCSLNNINGTAYMINDVDLDNLSKIANRKIAEAAEKISKYLKR